MLPLSAYQKTKMGRGGSVQESARRSIIKVQFVGGKGGETSLKEGGRREEDVRTIL